MPIPNVIDQNNELSTDNKTISNIHTQYWGELFQSNSKIIKNKKKVRINKQSMEKDFLQNIPKLSEQNAKFLEAPITERDIYDSIINSPISSPGIDGFNAMLYQLKPTRFAKILSIIYQYQIEQKRLTPSMQRSIVQLLYKKGSKSLPQNYRPINLINSDTKILSKILTYRLKKVIHTIIHDDQCGFIPNRSIQSNIIRLHDIQQLVKYHNQKEANVMLLDFQKAFDSINWSIRDTILKSFNFPNKFIEIINTLYYNNTLQLNINGALSNSFQPAAGVKQGDPLSPYLFALYIEPMAIKIREVKNKYGIQFNGNYNPEIISLFADDTLLYSKSYESTLQILKLVEKFCNHSGMKLNLNKSIMIPLHPNSNIYHNNTNNEFKILEKNTTTKYLGIPIGIDITEEQQYNSILQKIYHRLNIWYKRGKTLKGRKTILNTIIGSTLWYSTICSKISNFTIQPLEKLFKNFIKGVYINSNNLDTYKKRITSKNIPTKWIETDINEGGLNYTNINTQIKLLKINKLIQLLQNIKNNNGKFPNWAKAFEHQLSLVNTNITKSLDILFCNQHKQRGGLFNHSWENKLSKHWIDILKIWNSLNITTDYKKYSIQNYKILFNHQPIWNNKFLLINKKLPLNRGTRTDTAQNLYQKLQHQIYSFSDIQNDKSQFINIKQFTSKFQLHDQQHQTIHGVYNRIVKLHKEYYNENQNINNSNQLELKNHKTIPIAIFTPWAVTINDTKISINKLSNSHRFNRFNYISI